MELKDVILSTLAEMEENTPQVEQTQEKSSVKKSQNLQKNTEPQTDKVTKQSEEIHDDEMLYLTSMRERLLVLFEGFQAPNNTNIEAKVDMTLNFLEYVLATLENRIEKIKKEGRS